MDYAVDLTFPLLYNPLPSPPTPPQPFFVASQGTGRDEYPVYVRVRTPCVWRAVPSPFSPQAVSSMPEMPPLRGNSHRTLSSAVRTTHCAHTPQTPELQSTARRRSRAPQTFANRTGAMSIPLQKSLSPPPPPRASRRTARPEFEECWSMCICA